MAYCKKCNVIKDNVTVIKMILIISPMIIIIIRRVVFLDGKYFI